MRRGRIYSGHPLWSLSGFSFSGLEVHIEAVVELLVGQLRGRARHRIGTADHGNGRLVVSRIAGGFENADRQHLAEAVEHETDLDLRDTALLNLGIAFVKLEIGADLPRPIGSQHPLVLADPG